MRRIFWGFCRIGSSWVPYTTFRAVPILASNSRRYSYSKNYSPLSPIRGVADSPYWWYGELPTPRIVESGSRQLPAHWYAESATPRITDTESRLLNFSKENSLYRWYGESSTPRTSDTVSRKLPYRWVGESPTPRITDMESRLLRISLSRRVDDSAESVIQGVVIQRQN